MINFIRPNGRTLYLYPHFIGGVFTSEDGATIIRTTDGRGYMVNEAVEEVLTAIDRHAGQRH
jgi:uncharacterized protein YlzI (FlbEa/FlbD family)